MMEWAESVALKKAAGKSAACSDGDQAADCLGLCGHVSPA